MTNKPTFTERTAALTRLPQARLLPAELITLMQDMAAAIDQQNEFNHKFMDSMDKILKSLNK